MRNVLAMAVALLIPVCAWSDEPAPDLIRDQDSSCSLAAPAPGRDFTVHWIGECVDGKAQGRGIADWSGDGSLSQRAEGDWRAGLLEGLAIVAYGDGRRLEAEFHDNQANGRCVKTTDESRYDGRCTAGSFNGRGTMTWTNGNRYDGDFRDGKMNGRGVYAWKDGRIYEGDFVDGLKTGKGKQVWPTSAWYEGEWANDQQEGQGVEVFASGGKYQGQYKNGYPDGFGEYLGASSGGNVRTWSGQWRQGCLRTDDGGTVALEKTSKECGFE